MSLILSVWGQRPDNGRHVNGSGPWQPVKSVCQGQDAVTVVNALLISKLLNFVFVFVRTFDETSPYNWNPFPWADSVCFLQRATAHPPRVLVPPVPVLVVPVSHTGQHSPSGIATFSQFVSSSHWISSHRTWPLSQTQIRHGSGFQMSLFVYTWPSALQLKSSPGTDGGGGGHSLSLSVLCQLIKSKQENLFFRLWSFSGLNQ